MPFKIKRLKENRLVLWFISQFFTEFKYLFTLAWPIILMNLFRFLNPTISVIMCGHLTKLDYDASSMANVIINIFGVSIDLGFSTACDTLFSQVYGSRSKKRLGIMLQRAILVMTVLFLILSCFHLNIEPLLILLDQDVEISRLTAKYVILFLPGLFFDFQFLAISRYLQNQNIVYPMMICSGIGCVFNTVAQYIAIYVLNFGIDASAIIQGSTCFLVFALQLTYVIISKVYVATWQGIEFWSALEEWGIFFKLGLPGIVMIGVEDWSFEIMLFVAGSLSDVQLGALSGAFQVGHVCYMLHVGMAIAVAIRAGQNLGAGLAKEASLTAKTVYISDMMISVCTFTFFIGFRKYIPYVFTNDEEIRLFMEQLLVLFASIHFLDAALTSSSGIFRACGKQKIGAIVMMFCFYGIGTPLGFILVYVAKTDIRGYFLGLMTGLAIEVTIYAILVYRINWQDEARKAAERVKESRLSQCDDEVSEPVVSEKMRLLDSGHDNEPAETLKQFIIPKVFTHSRPSSNVTDILILTMKDLPKVSQNNIMNKHTIMKRSIFTSICLILFLLSLLCKIYLPRGLYIPCIPVGTNTTSVRLDKHYPFCNDTLYHF